MIPLLNSLPIKDRLSFVFLEKGQLDVLDGAFVLVEADKVRTQIPIGKMACIFLETGARISHEAVKVAARLGVLIVWVGDAGVRLYSAGQPGGARSDRLLHQAKLALDPEWRLRVVRRMYTLRFGEVPPEKRSVEQLRGLEGARVRRTYQLIAERYGVKWDARKYAVGNFSAGDIPNRCLSAATSCLYGICEAAILAAGFSPAVGFIHNGKPRSFVYDVADVIKFETVVPVAFKIAASSPYDAERSVRLACRDSFREGKVLRKLVPLIENVLFLDEVSLPEPTAEIGISFDDEEIFSDVGYRT